MDAKVHTFPMYQNGMLVWWIDPGCVSVLEHARPTLPPLGPYPTREESEAAARALTRVLDS